MPDNAQSFKVGDVVQLKSGGPKMTISSPGTNPGWWYCIWFDKDGKQKGNQFDPSTLTKPQ
jgi:uncharacterized protein YodC (DUF2158 family)